MVDKGVPPTSCFAPQRLRLSSFLPYRLNVLASLVSEGLARTYSERFGLAVPEWRLLATIAEFKSITATAVGLHSQMSKAMVSRSVTTLESRGLISRMRNEEDMRESFLILSAEGEIMYNNIVPVALSYVAALEGVLSLEEIAILDSLIDRLTLVAQSQ